MAYSLNDILSIHISDGVTVTRGSGVLMASGSYVLTAAHLFDNYKNDQVITITSANGEQLYQSQIHLYHRYDKNSGDLNHDIAVIKLIEPSVSVGLELSDEKDFIGVEFSLTGFGNEGELHTGTNVFDGDGNAFNFTDGTNIVSGTQVVYDYDNGLNEQNASSGYLNLCSSAEPTSNETIAKQGDSGGALIVGDKIAAITSYIFRNDLNDINNIVDSSYGEIGAATFVPPYVPWIDYIVEGNPVYLEPIKASDVITSITEPFGGEILNYFLLQKLFNTELTVTLWYETRDGTATAGLDYKSTEGWLDLLPQETYQVIPVTVYGDVEYEDDETFSLVISDPTGEWVDAGVELIAIHTIINNDII
ncbi:MAG TPA: trypsin-like serine protease [Gammaproteobacteria bacterium]|jgi:hypothetical protein|nr:trypsin-like serine protease [Gammaproteobacteria bacterium]